MELMRRDIFEGSDGNHGVPPRMHDELRRAGLTVNEKRVRRLMRLHGMAGRCRRRRCQTTFPGPDGYHIPDLVGRCFEPGRRRAGHGVVSRTSPTSRPGRGWLYLASVLDLGPPAGCSGYSMADHMRTKLRPRCLLYMAVAAATGGQVAGVIGHADRRSQYTSNDYLELLPAASAAPLGWSHRGVLG